MFLTERKLGTLLTEKPESLADAFNGNVLWENDRILAELRSIKQR
jgi:hypothetical protein